MAATIIVDANGTPITLGATVKIVGVVTEINPFSAHYNEITVTLAHPVAGVPDIIVAASGTSKVPAAGAVKTLNVPPTMLVVGA